MFTFSASSRLGDVLPSDVHLRKKIAGGIKKIIAMMVEAALDTLWFVDISNFFKY